MRVCAECGGELEAAYRFCPWCAAPQRRKLVEFFRAHPRDEGRGAEGLALPHRGSARPLQRLERTTASPRPRCHSSEQEAERLAAFLATPGRVRGRSTGSGTASRAVEAAD